MHLHKDRGTDGIGCGKLLGIKFPADSQSVKLKEHFQVENYIREVKIQYSTWRLAHGNVILWVQTDSSPQCEQRAATAAALGLSRAVAPAHVNSSLELAT